MSSARGVSHKRGNIYGLLASPIDIPSLADRMRELPRVVEEYARDAIAQLGTGATFTKHDVSQPIQVMLQALD